MLTLLLSALTLLFPRAVFAGPARDAAYEAEVARALGERSPAAVEHFREGNAARERNDNDAAARSYTKARELAPGFAAVSRRLCGVRLELGQRVEAIELCRAALREGDEAESSAALALTLVRVAGSSRPSAGDASEAQMLAERAVQLRPRDEFTLSVLCEVGMHRGDGDALRRCSSALLGVRPDSAAAHYYASLAAASRGDLSTATRELESAHQLGLPDDGYEALKGAYAEAMPWHERYGKALLVALGLWSAGMVLLLAAGFVLSRQTLEAATRLPNAPGGSATGVDRWLKRVYAAVLWVSCWYYYVSLPLVAASVLLLGGGLIYGFFAVGGVPIKLVAIIAVLVAVSLWAMLKSLLFRPKAVDPGEQLDLDRQPRLRAVLHEVASAIGTRPVDVVLVTPGTDVAVFERGGVLTQLLGRAQRRLILGVGVLEGFELPAFKAVLAHEYGHFRNEDTAGGGLALAVRRSVLSMARELAQGGAAGWYNPAWLFLTGFYKVFLRISQGASRLQEVLADRWAAFAYGPAAFTAGLTHVITRSIQFDHHVDATLGEVIERQRALPNLYRYRVRDSAFTADQLRTAVDEAVNAEPSPYDSHPSPRDRFSWVAALPFAGVAAVAQAGGTARDLFDERQELERRMTARVREAIENAHGVVIAASKPKRRDIEDDEHEGSAVAPSAEVITPADVGQPETSDDMEAPARAQAPEVDSQVVGDRVDPAREKT